MRVARLFSAGINTRQIARLSEGLYYGHIFVAPPPGHDVSQPHCFRIQSKGGRAGTVCDHELGQEDEGSRIMREPFNIVGREDGAGRTA